MAIAKTDNNDDMLPDYTPISPDDQPVDDVTLAQAASEPRNLNPVFGGDIQPQGVFDAEVVGTTEPQESAAESAPSFDPEKDARMKVESDEE